MVLYKCQVKERAVILNGQFLFYFKSLVNTIVLLRDVFHIGLVIVPRPEAQPNANTADRGPITRPIRVITKLPNSEQSYKGKVKTHNYINRQNQSTTGKL